MPQLTTFKGRQFSYKKHPDGEIIVYPRASDGGMQNEYALVITPFVIKLVKDAISTQKSIAMGASRDAPLPGSLGARIKLHKQTPQQLSYLLPILESEGFCVRSQQGRAFYVEKTP